MLAIIKKTKMKRILTFSFFFFLFIQFSNAQIEETDLLEFEKLMNEFETVLKKYYPNSETNKTYQKYLSDLLQRKLNPNIINEENTIRALKNFMKSNSFKKVWISNPKKNNKKKYVINYNGEFYNYLLKNSKNKDLKQSLQEFKKLNTDESMPFEPSPYIVLGAYQGYLKKNEFRMDINRIAISTMFYYDIMIEQKIK